MLAKRAGESVLTTRISSEGVETPVDLGAKPEPTAPSGTTGTGEVASPSLVIPSNPIPVKPED